MVSGLVRVPDPISRDEVVFCGYRTWPYDWHWEDVAWIHFSPKIYGQNFIKIKSKDLYDTWWAENRQFVLGDEISGSDKRAEADMMKAMITQEEVNINIKYIPQFSIPDCVNYYLTSNHADALFLEDEDRRFFVHEVWSARWTMSSTQPTTNGLRRMAARRT
jgi:hypothetical protein